MGDEHPVLGEENPIIGDENPVMGDDDSDQDWTSEVDSDDSLGPDLEDEEGGKKIQVV